MQVGRSNYDENQHFVKHQGYTHLSTIEHNSSPASSPVSIEEHILSEHNKIMSEKKSVNDALHFLILKVQFSWDAIVIVLVVSNPHTLIKYYLCSKCVGKGRLAVGNVHNRRFSMNKIPSFSRRLVPKYPNFVPLTSSSTACTGTSGYFK